mgnify:CR=1 FL=1
MRQKVKRMISSSAANKEKSTAEQRVTGNETHGLRTAQNRLTFLGIVMNLYKQFPPSITVNHSITSMEFTSREYVVVSSMYKET